MDHYGSSVPGSVRYHCLRLLVLGGALFLIQWVLPLPYLRAASNLRSYWTLFGQCRCHGAQHRHSKMALWPHQWVRCSDVTPVSCGRYQPHGWSEEQIASTQHGYLALIRLLLRNNCPERGQLLNSESRNCLLHFFVTWCIFCLKVHTSASLRIWFA